MPPLRLSLRSSRTPPTCMCPVDGRFLAHTFLQTVLVPVRYLWQSLESEFFSPHLLLFCISRAVLLLFCATNNRICLSKIAVEYTGTKLGVCTAMPAVGPDEDGNEQPSIEVMTDYAPDMGTKTYFNKQCKVTMDQSPQFQLLDYSFDHEACAIPLPDWEPAPEDEAGLCNANSNGYQEAVKWYCTADDSTINSLRGINTATFKGSVCDATKSEIIGMSLKPAFTCMPDTVTGKDESFSYTSCRAAADGSNKLIVGYDMYDGKLCYGQAKDSGEVEMDAECTNNGDGTMEGVVCQGF